jgi:hypothetical protein
VQSDVEVVAEYLAAAEGASGDLALALVRAACECIEGPPLASCVIGYDWFAREGHDHKLARTLSRAVARVLDHAIGEGHLDLARMLIERAAFINPYSETLARAAMTLAAASHDVDQLQQEWNQHLERLDTLEPGLAPSAMTEAHYWRLHGICAGLTTP